MKFLNKINSPSDLKKLNLLQLKELSKEINEFVVFSLSKTGGHLSSNLGVIDLTIALHYCFDCPYDKIVWDVGHQSYIHKILTGRKDLFNTLRKKDGLSGFPKTEESKYDCFNTGHSSTSISAALGIAEARDLNNQSYNVIAVIGDGAMTGGISFEALNNMGSSNKKMIVILNDNQMSISENVGSVSKYLNQLRTMPIYIEAKTDIQNFLKKIPHLGTKINKTLEKVKSNIKNLIMSNVMFEEMGIKYIGPIDGHNLSELIKCFNNIQNINSPVLIHVLTKKGYGYLPAEKYPDIYHGVSPFDILNGEFLSKKTKKTYSDIFGQFMVKEAHKNKKLVAITAAMPAGTGLKDFSKLYPKRFFDVGIAEQHAVIFSAGLAINGFIPVFAVYSTFLQRAYDQIIHDVCLQNLHIVFAIDRSSVVGEDGDTHQGIFDISYLSHIPNLTIVSPKNGAELIKMLDFSINKHKGPIAIRYPKASVSDIFCESEPDIEFGKSETIFLGKKILLISVGNMIYRVKKVYEHLKNCGFDPTLVNARFIKPIDKNLIENIKNCYDYIFTFEDNVFLGGFGNNFNNLLIQNKIFNKKIFNFAFPDEFIPHGSIDELFEKYGLDEKTLCKKTEQILKKFYTE